MFYLLFLSLGCAFFDSGEIEQTCEDLQACDGDITMDDTAIMDSAVPEDSAMEDTAVNDTGEAPEPEPEPQYIRPTHFSISAIFRMAQGRVLPFEDRDAIYFMLSIEENTEYFDPADVVCTFAFRSQTLEEVPAVSNMWFVFELLDIGTVSYESRCDEIDPDLLRYLEYNLLYEPFQMGSTTLNNAMIPHLQRYAVEQLDMDPDRIIDQASSFSVRSYIDGSATTIYPGVLMGTYMDQQENPDYYFSMREIETRMDGAYWSIPLRSFSIPSY